MFLEALDLVPGRDMQVTYSCVPPVLETSQGQVPLTTTTLFLLSHLFQGSISLTSTALWGDPYCLSHFFRTGSCHFTYLYREAPASSPGSLQEAGAVVVEVEYCDVHSACGTTGWAPPILNLHQELVAALPLSVQGLECGHFSWECRIGIMCGAARV